MISDYSRYEVRRIRFAYGENPTKGKLRPVVIALVDRSAGLALALKVTGHGPRPEYPGEVRLLDWREAGLSKPSTVRCSKLAAIDLEALGSSELYGCLTLRDATRVRLALEDLGIIE